VGCSGLLLHFLMLLLYAYNVSLATSSAETTLVTVTNLQHFQCHIWNSVWRLDQHTRTHTHSINAERRGAGLEVTDFREREIAWRNWVSIS
jgi:hypothetical protein